MVSHDSLDIVRLSVKPAMPRRPPGLTPPRYARRMGRMWQISSLSNGLTVVTVPMPHARSVGVALVYGVGACHEPDELAGMSHFVEHLCFKGTPRRPSPKDISSEIEGVGGILNGGTGREETAYFAKVSRAHWPMAVDLLFDMTQNSLFD
ncbi:MAG TPA: insulinase family protein, partial [Dehalococcoidia bacterium]|nr:insulinase family protein [Dehalococcoidia bacterium]